MRMNDTVSGALLIALATAMIYLTLSFPPFPGQKYGPSLFPRLLGAGLIICGALLVVRGLKARTMGQPLVHISPALRDGRAVLSFLLMLAAILFYILFSEWLGFILTSAAILLVLFLWFRVNPLLALPLAIGATFLINWFFGSVMRVPLPRGLLTNIL
jgi:putative tricarboxylic transport membrane protein